MDAAAAQQSWLHLFLLLLVLAASSLYRDAVGTLWRPRGVFGAPVECCNPSIIILRAQIYFLYCCWLRVTTSMLGLPMRSSCVLLQTDGNLHDQIDGARCRKNSEEKKNELFSGEPLTPAFAPRTFTARTHTHTHPVFLTTVLVFLSIFFCFWMLMLPSCTEGIFLCGKFFGVSLGGLLLS